MPPTRATVVKALNAAGRCAAIVGPVVGLVLFARQLLGSPRGRRKPHGPHTKTTRGSQRRRLPRQPTQQQQEADAASEPQQRDSDEELVDGIHDGTAVMQLYTEHDVDMLHHQAKNSRVLLQSMQQSGLQVTALHGDRGSPALSDDDQEDSSSEAAAGGAGGSGRYSPDLLQPLLQMLQQKVLEEPLTSSRRQAPQQQQQQPGQSTAAAGGGSSSSSREGPEAAGSSSATSEQQAYLLNHHLLPNGQGPDGQPPLPMFDPLDPDVMGAYMDDYDPSVDFDYNGPDLDYDGLEEELMRLDFDPVNGQLFDPGSGFDPERCGYLPGAGPQGGSSSSGSSSSGSSSRPPPAAAAAAMSGASSSAAITTAAAAGGGWGPSAPPPPPLDQLPPYPLSSFDGDQGGYIDDYDYDYDDDDIMMDPADEDALYAAMFNVEDWDPVNMPPYVFDPVDQGAEEELGRALDAMGIPQAAAAAAAGGSGGGGGSSGGDGRRGTGGAQRLHHPAAAAAAAMGGFPAAAEGGGSSSVPAWQHDEEEAGYWSEEDMDPQQQQQQEEGRALRFHPQQVSQQQVQAALRHLQGLLRDADPETAAGGSPAAVDGAAAAGAGKRGS